VKKTKNCGHVKSGEVWSVKRGKNRATPSDLTGGKTKSCMRGKKSPLGKSEFVLFWTETEKCKKVRIKKSSNGGDSAYL